VRADFNAETTLQEIASLLRTHGLPQQVTFDRDVRFVSSPQGSDYPSALVRFCHCLGVAVHICDPHQPQQNGFVERYHRSYQEECQARPSSPKSSSIKLAKSSGMINKLFLLRSVSDVSDCSLPEAARKGKKGLGTGVPANPSRETPAPLSDIRRRWWSTDRGRSRRTMRGKPIQEAGANQQQRDTPAKMQVRCGPVHVRCKACQRQ